LGFFSLETFQGSLPVANAARYEAVVIADTLLLRVKNIKCWHFLRLRCIQIKLKNVNKKRMATARRLIFLEFLKTSIADLITQLFSSLQNSKGGGDGDSETFGRKLAEK
jgi:hypothetical protein